MNRSAPRSIDQYLRQLREELAGADSALIQDALYDAEEYLRAEVAAHPDKSESDVLELIASTYGAPDEVASAYRDTEVKVKAAMATPRKDAKVGAGQHSSACSWILAPIRPCSSCCCALATGIIYFVFAVDGLVPVRGLGGADHRRAFLSHVHGGLPRGLFGRRPFDRGDDRRAHAAPSRVPGQRLGILGADR